MTKKELRNRWKSIMEKAYRNMQYGSGGSYGTGDEKTVPSLEKDRQALPELNRIMRQALKD